jgi:hypothetical protein
LWGNGSDAAPELAPDNADHLLLLSWQMSSTSNLNFVQSADGSNWVAGMPSPFGAASPYSPAMMVVNPPPPGFPAYYLCWVGWHQPLNLTASSNLTSWAYPIAYLQQPTIGPPELGYSSQYGQVMIAWTGPDQHMNVMMLPG